MTHKRPKLYYVIFLVLAIASGVVVYYASSRIIAEEKKSRDLQLERANRIAATELREALNTYATLLSGIRSYIEIEGQVNHKETLKEFLNYQLSDLEMDPPFSVTYVDTNHVIVYDFVFKDVEEVYLNGTAMKSIIGTIGVRRMDSLMRKEGFYASNPTNLLEGEVGLPLGFGILDDKGNSKGYITSVALFAPIVDRVYQIVDKDNFVLSFQSGNGNYFDRTRSYNKQKIYTTQEDPEYFKNFDVSDKEYVYAEVPFYNNNFIVGTAFKEPYTCSPWVFITSLLWYFALLGFMLFLLSRFYIYKRKNKTIAAQKQQLTELVATKNKFFSIIAHDLRSPLSSVVNFLDILRSEGSDTTTNKKIVEALGDSSKNSLTLLDNLLKWSKVQTGNITYDPKDIDLAKIALDQIKVQKHTANQKKLRIDVECSFNSKLKGDKNLIANVIRNLLSNAIKFSYNNSVIVVDISKQGQYASFSVEDTGVGIPPKHIDKLFDVTEITTQLGTGNERGSGLGLVLCKQFIEMHGGKLHLESQIEKGTIASFTLPLDS